SGCRTRTGGSSTGRRSGGPGSGTSCTEPMRAASLDRRVRKEARILVREARTAGARIKPVPDGLAEAAAELEAGLAAGDLARVRRGLPRLDELVEELPRTRRSVIDEYAWAIGVLVVLVLSIRMFVVEAFKIPS